MELLAPARGTLITEKSYPEEKDFTDAPPRIGLFVCHCGINIGSVVDVPGVVELAKGIPGVVYAEAATYACADNSQARIKDIIGEHNLNRLIVASCSPRTHEAIFRDTARECGLNPYLVEMANIRDQCSWVHASDHQAATDKALDLIRMTVSRTCHNHPLIAESMPVVQEALVIGGGATGLSAALSLAKQGFKTHVVEKQNVLGGRLASIYRTLAGEEVQKFRAGLISAVGSHPNISVHLGAEVKKLDGHIGNFVSLLSTGETIRHGVVIVATGGAPFRPDEYLLGKNPKVITQYELEESLFKGQIDLPKGGTVVMIQCAGSRNEERPFCSRVCCSAAIKNALAIKKQKPGSKVVVLYREMRTYGEREQAYQEAREAGVLFVRYEQENPPKVSESGGLKVTFTEPGTGQNVEIAADMVALSTGIAPGESNLTISELAKIPLNIDGFFLEAHMKLRPVDFASEGIFLCGLAHSPKPLEENISQALAAAGRAATVLSRKTLPIGGQISVVDIKKCASCLTCVKVCPYGAPIPVNKSGKTRVQIDAAKCMGCGSCASECPGKAIELQHFLDIQITAAIDAMVEELTLL
jgi:heterodisulfide reductase subunit A